MKNGQIKRTLVVVMIAFTALVSVAAIQQSRADAIVFSGVEALSSGESYLDYNWNVEVRYHSSGELSITCNTGGKYQCPLKDPGISV